MSDVKVFLAMPDGDGMIPTPVARAFYEHPTLTRAYPIYRATAGGSLLAFAFNNLLAAAYSMIESQGITHFAMLHSDCAAEPGWLDTLLAECERLEADVISTVIPMKDGRGLTSTAVGSLDPWEPVRRLAMRQVFDLPETFGLADMQAVGLAGPEQVLLLNTGCWVANITRPFWQAAEDGVMRFRFTIDDRIVRLPDGSYQVDVASEDWNMSRYLHRVGASVWATRKVRVHHWGRHPYSNDKPWGSWGTDQTYESESGVEPAGIAFQKPGEET